MGVTVRQKIPGKGQPWWVFIAHEGKRTSRMVGAKDAAETVAATIQAQLQLKQFSFDREEKEEEEKAPPMLTFKEYAEKVFMAEYAAHNHKESTQDSYGDILKNHVYDSIGNKPLDQITKQDIKNLLVKKRIDGYAPATVKLIKAYMASVFEYAVGDDEILTANPVRSLGKKTLEIIRKKDLSDEIKPLTRQELTLLLWTVEAYYPDHYPLFLVLARTGMRVGEALGLQWGDIDFAGRFIEIKRQYSKGRISVPKNGKTRRVDMSPQLADTLRLYQAKSFPEGENSTEKFVFINQAGRLIDLDHWRQRVFNEALKKAELRHIRVHDLRHTYATIRISEGHDIVDVSHQLGHHSEAFTLKVYHHWIPGQRKSEVASLDDKKPMHPSAPQLHPDALTKEKWASPTQLTH